MAGHRGVLGVDFFAAFTALVWSRLGSMSWISVVVFIVGAILYAVYGAEDLWRRFAMRRLAKKMGFAYLKERLPEALSLYGTSFNSRRFTWNVIDGQVNQLHVVVFDCQIGEGANNWRPTVIAIKTGSAGLSAGKLNPQMKVDSSGGWSICYYPEGTKHALMPLKDLGAFLQSI
jgi:hypothetical protein